MPLNAVAQAWLAAYGDSCASIRKMLEDGAEIGSEWAGLVRRLDESLPALDGGAYAAFRVELIRLGELFGKALNVPLSVAARQTCVEFVCEDLPQVVAVAMTVRADVDTFVVARSPSTRSGDPVESPKRAAQGLKLARVQKANFEEVLATIVSVRMRQAEDLVRKDVARWLASKDGQSYELPVRDGRAQFLFRRAGSVWKVILDGGEEFHIEDSLGAKYLDWLLHHPNEGISAFDLEQTITQEKAAVRNRDAFERDADPNAVRAYLSQLSTLRAELEEARENGDSAESTRLELEMAPILEQVKRCDLPKDAGERARNNVRHAIGAVTKKLASTDKHQNAFRMHISNFVRTGYRCEYVQAGDTIWQ